MIVSLNISVVYIYDKKKYVFLLLTFDTSIYKDFGLVLHNAYS